MTVPELDALVRECEQLLFRAARFTDLAQWDDLAAIFAQEGKLIRPSDPGNPIIGRVNILASLRTRPRRITRHVLSNIIVDAQSAVAAHISSTVTLFTGCTSSNPAPVKGQRILVGNFEDDVVWIQSKWVFIARAGSMSLEFDVP
jgi:hypothetical protein